MTDSRKYMETSRAKESPGIANLNRATMHIAAAVSASLFSGVAIGAPPSLIGDTVIISHRVPTSDPADIFDGPINVVVANGNADRTMLTASIDFEDDYGVNLDASSVSIDFVRTVDFTVGQPFHGLLVDDIEFTSAQPCVLHGYEITVSGMGGNFEASRFTFGPNWIALNFQGIEVPVGTIFNIGLSCQPEPAYCAATDHMYQLILDDGIGWHAARQQAEEMSYLGLAGHLATITSMSETQCILSAFPPPDPFQGAWLGGSEPLDDTHWQWSVGPEAGAEFSIGALPTPPFHFANWGGVEPNDQQPTEDYVYMNVGGPGFGIGTGQWADGQAVPNVVVDPVIGYVVEFEPRSYACCLEDPGGNFATCETMSLSSCTTQGGQPVFGESCYTADCGWNTCISATTNCQVETTTPGCGEWACCNTVCLIDSFCCEISWDLTCSTRSIQLGCGLVPPTEAFLSTSSGQGISTSTLKAKLDQLIPENNAHSRLVVLTQCYGGDMVVPLLAGTNKTGVLSASSPGQGSEWGGYHDDAAASLNPAPGHTSDALHLDGVQGSGPGDEPMKGGINVPLDPVDPFNGPIKSRHVMVYMGEPSQGINPNTNESVFDLPDVVQILQNLSDELEPTTTVTTVGSDGTFPWEYPGTQAGLCDALEEIAPKMNPNEQFILFVGDHGGLGQSAPCNIVMPGGGVHTCGEYSFEPSIYEFMQQDPNNTPSATVFVEQELQPANVDIMFGFDYYPGVSFFPKVEIPSGWLATVDIVENANLLNGAAYLDFSSGDLRFGVPISGPVTLTISGGNISKGGCLTPHGDVTFPYCVVDVDDLLYVLDGFISTDPCTEFPESDLVPCGQPCSLVDVDDILSVLDAFAGIYSCP